MKEDIKGRVEIEAEGNKYAGLSRHRYKIQQGSLAGQEDDTARHQRIGLKSRCLNDWKGDSEDLYPVGTNRLTSAALALPSGTKMVKQRKSRKLYC